METRLSPEFAGTPDGQQAESILRACVHCGFCTATCPTYQLLGDELDGPRGRIYLIKQVLEGAVPTRSTQQHLDRCLTCRNCETTCPSGVAYGQLVDIGRRVVDAKVQRPLAERAKRWALKEGLTSPLFGTAMKLGQTLKPLVPKSLQEKVPPATPASPWPTREHARKVLMLAGCVQPAMAPNINAATARVLDALGVQALVAEGAGCCGAIRQHLSDHDGALADMRRNIDAWWPLVQRGMVEAIVVNASGCGVLVKDYGRELQHDPAYADKAARVSALARDPIEFLAAHSQQIAAKLKRKPAENLAWHPPCTLQHGQRLGGQVESLLRGLGFSVSLPAESHLCCGSAGTYSVLQADLSKQLRERKLKHLAYVAPQRILSANIGCIQHLQAGTTMPVQHWLEFLDEALRN
ncbi:MAG: glycolate oxidase subunit GlcF [Betaproteobacteria bacterium]|nr:glycolate oxidase subunit GlcF [Betaproteobacteria bacterium]MDE2123398.1 glycolate oxidase subunit GlcF [Betaproteobacteria bacterium]MDE2187715.1 glycolate oxidase subunit GlcF [Betaproteobacteria bacterium]